MPVLLTARWSIFCIVPTTPYEAQKKFDATLFPVAFVHALDRTLKHHRTMAMARQHLSRRR
jgi:hypothetical protein